MADTLFLDYETASEVPIQGTKSVGLWNYMKHESTRALMLAYSFNKGPVQQVDFTDGDTLPPEVRDALTDPHVERHAFNASFERRATVDLLGIDTPIEGWRCTMVLSYMRSFKGGLSDIGKAIGLPTDKQKDARGKRLIHMFCQPQKPSKAHPQVWRDRHTDPIEWQDFLDYNRQDVVTEISVDDYMSRFPILESEWKLYEIDQHINDTGLPVSRQFVKGAMSLVSRRQAELFVDMRVLTGLENPNSIGPLLKWLQDYGYPASDLKKDTIKKVIEAHDDGTDKIAAIVETVLKMRQQASRTSVKKYNSIDRRLADDDQLRHCFQFCGAGRTGRDAGRGPQPQNLVKPPKILSDRKLLEVTSDAIKQGDYEALELIVGEPMTALAGCVRSVFQVEEDEELVVADLSSIESAVIAWLSGCKRMLRNFELQRDPYKDFATVLYNKSYDDVTPVERNICKPATLGCGFGMGGGRLINGKKTGLWAYAESMGTKITQHEAKRQVTLWRDTYPEVQDLWNEFAQAFERAMRGFSTTVQDKCYVERRSEFLTMELPSGRHIFYYKPKMEKRVFEGQTGPYTRMVFTCEGVNQLTTQWTRIMSPGPKVCENAVQAIARDILMEGVRRAFNDGFKLVGKVHDEIISKRRAGDNYYTLERLIGHMTDDIEWAKGMPLRAAGYVSRLYTKD